MTYEEAESYINDTPKFTKKNTLENTRMVLDAMGHPERKMKLIHVAGSNGKGSVCAYLSSILKAAGKEVGLFTSPHLVKINERFKINEEDVSDELFLEAFEGYYEKFAATCDLSGLKDEYESILANYNQPVRVLAKEPYEGIIISYGYLHF